MNGRPLYTDDDAVSSVLGVILMVAVTIVLAAVVGTFVLGIGQELTEEAPQVSFEFSYHVNDASGESTVTILHTGGEAVPAEEMEVVIAGETAWKEGSAEGDFTAQPNWPERVSGGDRLRLEDGGDSMESGDDLLIIWSDGEDTAIIADVNIE